MSEQPYQVASLEEMNLRPNPKNAAWAMVRTHFDVRAFGINAWTSDEAGQQVVSEHDELGSGTKQHEELYFVSSGAATFTVNGDEFEAPAGTFVFVRDPAARRGAVAKEAGTTVVAIGAPPGEVFEPSPWERSASAMRYWETEEFDKAVDELTKSLAEDPDNAGVLYNLACAHARLARRDEAIDFLRRAIAGEPRMREVAREDPDFESLKDDPDFQKETA